MGIAKDLFDMPQRARELERLLEESQGELTQEIETYFNSMIEDKKAVANNFGSWVGYLTSTIKIIKMEEERLYSRRKTLENRLKWIKTSLNEVMDVTGETEFKSPLHTIKRCKKGGRVPLDIDEKQLPDEYWVVTRKPDTASIYNDIKFGDVPGVEQKERGYYVRIS